MSRPCIASGGGGCHESARDVDDGEEQVKEEGARLGTSSAVETSTSGEFFGPVPTWLNACKRSSIIFGDDWFARTCRVTVYLVNLDKPWMSKDIGVSTLSPVTWTVSYLKAEVGSALR